MPLLCSHITVTPSKRFSLYSLPPCSGIDHGASTTAIPAFKSLQASKPSKPNVSLSIGINDASWITPMVGTVGSLLTSAIQVNTNLLATRMTKRSNSYKTLSKIALCLTHLLDLISAKCSISTSKLHSLSKEVEECCQCVRTNEMSHQYSSLEKRWIPQTTTISRRLSGTMTFPYLVGSPSTAAEAKMAEVASRTLHPATTYNVNQLKNNILTFEHLLRRERRRLTSQIPVSWRDSSVRWENRPRCNTRIQNLPQNQDLHEKLDVRS